MENADKTAPAPAAYSSIRSSASISKFAIALSKVLGEIINPPKTKKAVITPRNGGAPYEYSYVDFADGLEKIRPIFSKHGMAFIQIPFIDGSEMSLTTRLMFEDEWMESDYPVGPIGDHRTMGGALTYARRYALFPMVGVAGEEDLDAEPAVTASPATASGSGRKAPPPVAKNPPKQSGSSDEKPPELMAIEDSKRASKQMIDSLHKTSDRYEAQAWAKENQPVKLALQPEDAAEVSKAFLAHQRSLRPGSAANPDQSTADNAALN